jgi:hypothetical protein
MAYFLLDCGQNFIYRSHFTMQRPPHHRLSTILKRQLSSFQSKKRKKVNDMDENKKCTCGGAMRFSHVADFKIGRADSDLNSLLISSPKISESTTLPLNVYVCPGCGLIRLFAGDEIKNSLVRIAENRSQSESIKSYHTTSIPRAVYS